MTSTPAVYKHDLGNGSALTAYSIDPNIFPSDLQKCVEYLKAPETLYNLAEALYHAERYDEACAELLESMRFFDQENDHSYSLNDENLPKITTLISNSPNRND